MEKLEIGENIVLNKPSTNPAFAQIIANLNKKNPKAPVQLQYNSGFSYGMSDGYVSSYASSYVSNGVSNAVRSSGFSNIPTITPQFCACPNFN